MSGEIQGNFAGQLTDDPSLKFSQGGKPWASFTVAFNPRKKQPDGSYTEEEVTFVRCVAFGKTAENAAESLRKGNRVVVAGRFKNSSWQGQDGTNHTDLACVVDELGASVLFDTVTVNKRQQPSQQGQQQPPQGQQQGPPQGQQGPPQGYQQPSQQGGWGPPPQQTGGWNQQGQQGVVDESSPPF